MKTIEAEAIIIPAVEPKIISKYYRLKRILKTSKRICQTSLKNIQVWSLRTKTRRIWRKLFVRSYQSEQVSRSLKSMASGN